MVAASVLSMAGVWCIANARDTSQDASTVFKNASPCVATLKVESNSGEVITGTAFLALKPGFAITSYHVVQNAKKVTASFINGEKLVSAGLIDSDVDRDLALIQIQGSKQDGLTLKSTLPDIGSRAFVIGSPAGLDFSISEGIVSQIRQIDGFQQIQYTAQTNPGNSGGPVLSSDGQVVGIVSWKLRNSDGLNFAIASQYAGLLNPNKPVKDWQRLVPELSKSEKEDDAHAAAQLLEIRVAATRHKAAAYDVHRETTTVSPVNLTTPSTVYDAIRAFRELASKLRKLKFRNEKLQRAVYEAANTYDEFSAGFADIRDACIAAMRSGWTSYPNSLLQRGYEVLGGKTLPWAGVMDVLKELTPSYATAQFHKDIVTTMFSNDDPWPMMRRCGIWCDIRALPGFSIAGVPPKSYAEKAGLRPADLVININKKVIADWSELELFLVQHQGQTVQLRVRRLKGGEATLKLEIPAK